MPTNIRLPQKPKTKEKKAEKSDRIIKEITFFGDSAIPEDDPIYKSVFEAAKLLAKNNYKIVNGGGPGLMKAATDGAESVDGETVAVYWEPKLASFFEGKNLANVADETESQSNYVTRTFGLIEKGDAYVICKGGTGTVSEFGLVWALAKLYFGKHKPIILYGNFWKDLIEAFQETMYIDEKELAVLYYAETPEEILETIQAHESRLDRTTLKKTNGDESAFLLQPNIEMVMKSYDKNAHHYHSQHAGKMVAQEQLDEFISMVNPPAKVLDLGCGPGLDTHYLSERYAVTGIDISKRFCEMAKFENPNVEILCGDFTKMDLKENTYKGIWARDSIHHVYGKDIPALFEKIYKALVGNGVFYVIVREGQGEIIEKETKTYGELERFYNLFTESELTKYAEAAGFELVKIDHTKRSHKWLVGVYKKPDTA